MRQLQKLPTTSEDDLHYPVRQTDLFEMLSTASEADSIAVERLLDLLVTDEVSAS